LNPLELEVYNPIKPFSPREARMPQYEFYCRACKKSFGQGLKLVDYEEGDIACPHCGSREVEHRWSVFSAIASKKSA
jgi:putative FmdB family regulatory protein